MEKRNGMLYPMMVIAAISIILFSVVGIATMTGHIPSALSQKVESSSETQAEKEAKFVEPVKRSEEPRAGTSRPGNPERDLVQQDRNRGYVQERTAAYCASCGVVESVKVREVKGQGTGLGVVGGAVIGGVLGHQIGSGRGNDLATVAGAVGGGYAGNEVEKNARKTTQYVIRIRMEDNTYRTITQAGRPTIGAGDRVRIENGNVIARG